MATRDAAAAASARTNALTKEERKSVTHGDFWIPEDEREKYKRVLDTLNRSGIPYVVSGAYAIYEHTGIYRETKDLDLFCEPEHVIPAMRALRAAGFTTRLEQPHWLSKAKRGKYFADLVYGMGNGLAWVSGDWYRHSTPAVLAATPVRVAPVEELIWHRMFISERHRQDMADVVHMILTRGDSMDWDRLLERTGPHWPLLLSQVSVFRYVYPGYRDQVPERVVRELVRRAEAEAGSPPDPALRDVTRGTLVSRFSFSIDVHEWGLHDLREEATREKETSDVARRLIESDVWDERAEGVPAPAASEGGR